MSEAAKEVKMGFWIAAGFSLFALVCFIILALSGRAFITGG